MTRTLCISLITGILGAVAVLWTAPAPAAEPAVTQPHTAADWPQWRGPTRDGIAPAGPKLLDAWPEDGPRLIWKSGPIPSAVNGGSGSITVAQGKAFVLVNARKQIITDENQIQAVFDEVVKELSTGRDPVPAGALLKLKGKFRTYDEFATLIQPDRDGGWGHRLQVGIIKKVFRYTDAIVCLDAATGKELWRSEFPGIGGDEAGDMGHFGASGTPAVVGDRIYSSGSAGLYCLSIKDGSVIWQTRTDYTHSSPLVTDHAVFVVLHEGLVAFSAQTGAKLWSVPVGGYGVFQCFAPCSSVVEWMSGGKSYLVGVANCGLYCVDPDKGKMLWQEPMAKQAEGSSTPAMDGDLAVVHGDKAVQAYKISPEKAELIWTAGKHAYRAASPLIYQGNVYAVTTDEIQCLDLKTGALKWQEKSNGNYCSPILVDGKIIHNTGHAWYPIFTMMFRARARSSRNWGCFRTTRNWTSSSRKARWRLAPLPPWPTDGSTCAVAAQ
ncbi:MAG TPA: PQQ-binding-like beta-propeller repeat protein [Tepidisphaeraceae bacterium]|jgi:outer membrane protein assembly factor BamB|nr:PQQ-binding-like beta-propeller repeat protein [Tepidisphaeraceae bacterium]